VESGSVKQSSNMFLCFFHSNSRITAKAPYQVNSSVGVEAPKQAAGVEKKPWLGLGQEATVKQEM